jgi:hypothetical protein
MSSTNENIPKVLLEIMPPDFHGRFKRRESACTYIWRDRSKEDPRKWNTASLNLSEKMDKHDKEMNGPTDPQCRQVGEN